MTARSEVIAAVTAAMPVGVAVVGYARQVDPPAVPTVLVRVDTVARPPGLPPTCRVYGFALVCIASLTDPNGPADDQLDGLLEDVLLAVDQAKNLTWASATRAVYADTNPAYEVTVNVHTTR